MTYKYGGRRSRGCDCCRKRKVKCGEEQPACARCLRINKQCFYRDSVDLLFHDETVHARTRAKRLWHARSADDQEGAMPTQTSTQLQAASATPDSLTELVLAPSQEDVMIQRFFFDFVLERNGTLSPPGYLEFVPTMYHHRQPGSSLALAMEAVAFANLGRRGHAPHLAVLASQRYGDAIQLTGAALKDPSKLTRDDTLLSCQLLGMYEMLTPSATSFSHWDKHNQGTMALLQVRGERQLETGNGTSMFRQAWCQEIVTCLRFCQHPTVPAELAKRAIPAASFRLYAVCGQAASIAADYLAFRSRRDVLLYHDEVTALESIRARASQLENTFELMQENLPAYFGYDLLESSDCIESVPGWLRPVLWSTGAPKYLHKYFNINAYNIANWMRWARLRLIQTGIHSTIAMHHQLNDFCQWIPVLHELVEEFCSGIPYMLMPYNGSGDLQRWKSSDLVRGVRGYFLVRVITATKMTLKLLRRLDAGMQDCETWVERFLAVVRSEIGIEPIAAPDPMDIPWELEVGPHSS